MKFFGLLTFLSLCFISFKAFAQSEQELANKLQNPVSDLISVPIQINYDQNIGQDEDGDRWLTNIQPVIPLSMNEDWNVISRTILPLISQQDIYPGYGEKSGNGDLLQSLFFSPKAKTPSGWTWGVGPAFSFPIASENEFGTEKWSIGPTAVGLRQDGPLTVGLLVNHLASFAGSDDRDDVNATFVQPFAAYTWKTGTALSINSETTFDWENDDTQMPINLVLGQLVPVGNQMFNVGIGLRQYLQSFDNGPDGTGGRIVVVWLLPK